MTGPQQWVKKGVIFAPERTYPWMQTHAALPVADRMLEGHRVYFSSRDGEGRAQIGFFDIDLERPCEIRRISAEPVIGLGPLGAFDDAGVTTSCVVTHEQRKYHYYSGWSLGVTVPFYFYVGLAVSDDNGETYHRISASPILERDEVDPYLTASPCVLLEDGKWRMWYVSGTGWEMHGGRPRHRYHIKYAEGSDGIHWQRKGLVCIDYQSEDEYAIARPCVVKSGDGYRMWYSCRGDTYRIGYAESIDGLAWTRKDSESGIELSSSGWDSEMMAYPYVFESSGKCCMLYNGNGYGKTGIGLAVLATS
jgi:hypothetical protein